MAAVLKIERTSAPTCSWNPSRNPPGAGWKERQEALQPSKTSDGGRVYVYDKGEQTIYEVNYSNISVTDIDSFIVCKNILKTGFYSFTLTPATGGATVTARLVAGTIDFQKITTTYGTLSFSMIKV